MARPRMLVSGLLAAVVAAAAAAARGAHSSVRFSSAASPIWGPSAAKYMFLRKEVALPAGATATGGTVAVTAAVSEAKEKLLGAYRLYVNGRSVGIGPGRGDVPTTALNHTQFDTITLPASVLSPDGVAGSGSAVVVLGLQSYSSGAGGSGKVILEANITHSGGGVVSVATGGEWKAFDATPYYNPTGNTGGAYNAPQEWIDASAWPGQWTSAGFDDSRWPAATVTEPFGFELLPKETLPLNITTGVTPPIVTTVSPTKWFFDFETEVMAGVRLEIPAGAVTKKHVVVTLSEELNGPYGSGELLYPMRTGNHYRYVFTPNPSGPSTIELHEYALFRYGTAEVCDAVDKDGGCITPQQCAVGDEKTTVALGCPRGQVITKVLFADYGEPTGQCLHGPSSPANSFQTNRSCTADNAVAVIEKLCLHQAGCQIAVGNTPFAGCHQCAPDGDPCHLALKHLSVAVSCSAAKQSDAAAAVAVGAIADPPFSISAWTVAYPWSEQDSNFESSNEMLNRVYRLCRNTLRVTSLDTTTDSNTRERLPYEADGYITGNSRYHLQREYAWQLHSARHNFVNPTWPTEWRQFMPLIALEHYKQTGDATLAADNWDLLTQATQTQCVNSTTQLVDFSRCARLPGTRDIVDWPQDARDGYKMTDVNTVISAFLVGSLNAMAELGRACGKASDADRFAAQANATAAAMRKLLVDHSTGLMVDGLLGAQTHSAWHAQTNALWFGVPAAEQLPKMLTFLRQKRVVGSVYAVYAYLMGLYSIDSDHGATALEMLTQCDDNSWCHMLNVNATATMEAWTRGEKPNLSWSHPWATAPVSAIVRGLIGLVPSAPAYAAWTLKPQPGNVSWFTARVPSKPGPFDIALNATASSFVATVTAPEGTSGTVCAPKLGAQGVELTVDGAPVTGVAVGDYVCTAAPLAGGKQHTVRRG